MHDGCITAGRPDDWENIAIGPKFAIEPGAEETRRHQPQRGFARDDNRSRFAQGRAIAWNIRVLNRFQCANRPISTRAA